MDPRTRERTIRDYRFPGKTSDASIVRTLNPWGWFSVVPETERAVNSANGKNIISTLQTRESK